MYKRSLQVISIALQTLRSNPLHTLLSTTGLVIGVAALVAILSLGDGLENYAREQISSTTSLEGMMIEPKTNERVDGVFLKRENIPHLKHADAVAIADTIKHLANIALLRETQTRISLVDDTLKAGIYFSATQPSLFEISRRKLEAGQLFESDKTSETPAVVLSYGLANKLARGENPATLINQTVQIGALTANVTGILEGSAEESPHRAFGAFASWSDRGPGHTSPAKLVARINEVEKMPELEALIGSWLDTHTNEGKEAFSFITNKVRIEQASKGIKVFKLVMGLITGIAVLVGGIGVMNVLLISINERTREIGIRKATGARKKDIVMQFLTESVTISFTGSLLGLGLGLLTLSIAIPIIKSLSEVPLEMGFSAGSLLVVLIVALVVGVVFGTYPAWRASNLSPVDAIRHE